MKTPGMGAIRIWATMRAKRMNGPQAPALRRNISTRGRETCGAEAMAIHTPNTSTAATTRIGIQGERRSGSARDMSGRM